MENSIIAGFGSLFDFLGSAVIMLLGYVANRYVIPFLRIGKRQKFAEYIARIADDVTDALRARYPDKNLIVFLDEAVDHIIKITGISPEIARRVISASIARK